MAKYIFSTLTKLQKRTRTRKQYAELTKFIKLGDKVTCLGCDRRVNFWSTCRCFWCGGFFCRQCCEKHFENGEQKE